MPEVDWHDLYIEQRLSGPTIANLLGISTRTVFRRLRKHSIPVRTRGEGRRGTKLPESAKRKIAASRSLYHGENHPMYGRKHTEETKRKISIANKGQRTGSLAPNWQGGIASMNRCIRGLPESKEWRKAIFLRDKYTCQLCSQRGGVLNADHIVPFSYIIKSFDISSLEAARACSALWDLSNGRTLCIHCHRDTPTYAGRLNNA